MSKSLTTILNESHDLEMAIMESYGEITPAIADRLTINEIEQKEKVDAYEVIMERLEMAEKFWKDKASAFNMQAKAYATARDKMRDGIKFKMLELGKDEIFGHDIRFKLSRTAPSLNIIPEMISEDYKYQVVSTEIDKAKIKEALKDGKEVMGAELKENVALRKYSVGPKQKQVTE